MRFDDELKGYYERKVHEGKNPLCVLNAVKSKLIARIFSVVRNERVHLPREIYLKAA